MSRGSNDVIMASVKGRGYRNSSLSNAMRIHGEEKKVSTIESCHTMTDPYV